MSWVYARLSGDGGAVGRGPYGLAGSARGFSVSTKL